MKSTEQNTNTPEWVESETNTEDLADASQESEEKLQLGSGWKNPPKLSDLKQDYTAALDEFSSHVEDVNKWLDNYDGKLKHPIKDKKRSKIVPKLIRKQAEWRYASLEEAFLSTPDMFKISPVTFEDKPRAIQNELLLNNQINTKLNKEAFISKYVKTAVDEGTVIVQVGWTSEEGIVTVDEPVIVQLPLTTQEQLEQVKLHYPEQLERINQMMQQGEAPYVEIQQGTRQVQKKKMIKNHPTLDIKDYANVMIDPTCLDNPEEAEFIIVKLTRSYADLEAEGVYSNLEDITVTESEFDGYNRQYTNFEFRDKPRSKITVYEYWGYWDINGDGNVKPIIAAWAGDTLIRLEESPFTDGLPFVVVPYLPVRNSPFGEPDGALLEDNQDVIGALTRGTLDMMAKSANGQRGSLKGALDPTNKRRFEAGQDYQFEEHINPDTAFHVGKYPEIPRSALELMNLFQQDSESLTGVKAFNTGISGQALGNTATSVRGALDSASKRELSILRRLAKGIEMIGRKMLAMNAQFLSAEEIVRVTNSEFVTVRRDDLEGNFDLHLGISTPEVDNAKAQDLSFMLQTTAQSMGPEFTTKILAEWARLKKMPELAKDLADWKPQPNELDVQAQQLELEKLKAEIAERMSRAKENGADFELKQAKAASEQAKAGKTNSEKDMTDLEFLRRQSGVARQEHVEDKMIDHQSKLDQKALDHTVDLHKQKQQVEASMAPMNGQAMSSQDMSPKDDATEPKDLVNLL